MKKVKNTIRPDKNPLRVHPAYKTGTADWEAEYDMLLPDGITCKECRNCNRCVSLFGSNAADTTCQWFPSRYSPVASKSIL